MRSMWKGAISFGLVMIPVRLYAATEPKDLPFHQVHSLDGGRIKFRRFCSVCRQEVPYEAVAKGYELDTGEVVILDDDDLARMPLPTAKSIEVTQFVPARQLDPILFSRSYYAEPETAGVRAYVLLRDALAESGRVAIARVALRQRESLATLREREGVLVLETLLWPDEVRDASFAFQEQQTQIRPREREMARSLIETMAEDFDPAAHRDRYREALAELVEAKIEGADVVAPRPPEAIASPDGDLADVLEASLAGAREPMSADGQARKADGGRDVEASNG